MLEDTNSLDGAQFMLGLHLLFNDLNKHAIMDKMRIL